MRKKWREIFFIRIYINLSECWKKTTKICLLKPKRRRERWHVQFSFNLRTAVSFFRNIASAKYKQTAGETKVGWAARLSVRRFRSRQEKRRPLYQFKVIFSLESGANKPISLTPQIFRGDSHRESLASSKQRPVASVISIARVIVFAQSIQHNSEGAAVKKKKKRELNAERR